MTPPNFLEQMMLSLMLLGNPSAQAPAPVAACDGAATCKPCEVPTVCASSAQPISSQLPAHQTACERLLLRQSRFEQLAQEGGNSRKIERLSKQRRAVQEHAQRMGCPPKTEARCLCHILFIDIFDLKNKVPPRHLALYFLSIPASAHARSHAPGQKSQQGK